MSSSSVKNADVSLQSLKSGRKAAREESLWQKKYWMTLENRESNFKVLYDDDAISERED